MSENDETLSRLSHDAKGALTSIKAYAELLLRSARKTQNSEMVENLEKLGEKVNELNTLLTQLTDYAKKTS